MSEGSQMLSPSSKPRLKPPPSSVVRDRVRVGLALVDATCPAGCPAGCPVGCPAAGRFGEAACPKGTVAETFPPEARDML